MTTSISRADSGIKMKRKTLPEVDEYAMCDYDLKKDEVAAFTNEYVLGNWNFEDASAKIEYLKHRVGHLAYEYFPSGLDERMVLVARLMALLYLIGGKMSCSKLYAAC